MDIFTIDKYNYRNGEIVNGIDSVLWVERYDKPGEVTIHGDPSPQLRETLKEGTLISHIGTQEVMMIEDHLIEDKKSESPKIKITGRSALWVMMENRVLTTSLENAWVNDVYNDSRTFNLPTGSTWDQILVMIRACLETSEMGPVENLPNFTVRVDSQLANAKEVPPKQRSISTPTYLADEVSKLLVEADLGLKLLRPRESQQGFNGLRLIIHQGSILNKKVRFDWHMGELADANYLWSNKYYKNAAYSESTTMLVRRFPNKTSGWDTRVLAIDGNDVAGVNGYITKSVLDLNADQKLEKAEKTAVVDAAVSKDSVYDYGIDYNIGDVVFVVGNYGLHMPMRIVEHAKSKDESGETSIPTLGPILKPVRYIRPGTISGG